MQPTANGGHGDGGRDSGDDDDDEEVVVGTFTAVGPKMIDTAKRAVFRLLAGMAAGTCASQDPPAFWRRASFYENEAQFRGEVSEMADRLVALGPGRGRKG